MNQKFYRTKVIRGLINISGLFLLLVLSSCHSSKRITSNNYTLKEEKNIEKTEVEKLKGEEKIILKEAFEWLETPYSYGRQEKGVATDCSGFVMVVFEKTIGCKLPRNSAKQAEYCKIITHGEVRAGDLVFFITNGGSKINHVGIMIDKDKFLHASSKGVRVSDMNSDYYSRHFQKYGRVPCLDHK